MAEQQHIIIVNKKVTAKYNGPGLKCQAIALAPSVFVVHSAHTHSRIHSLNKYVKRNYLVVSSFSAKHPGHLESM